MITDVSPPGRSHCEAFDWIVGVAGIRVYPLAVTIVSECPWMRGAWWCEGIIAFFLYSTCQWSWLWKSLCSWEEAQWLCFPRNILQIFYGQGGSGSLPCCHMKHAGCAWGRLLWSCATIGRCSLRRSVFLVERPLTTGTPRSKWSVWWHKHVHVQRARVQSILVGPRF